MIIDPADVSGRVSYGILAGAIVPRPIAFVSTMARDGSLNLAPFSFFNAVCAEPPIVAFAVTVRAPEKDTLANIRATGEFVVNIVSEGIAAQMNACAGEYPADTDEFQVSGLTPVPSDLVRPPRVGESHVSLECRTHQILDVSPRPRGASLVLGEVVRFHVDEAVLTDGALDHDKLLAVGRMSGQQYCRTRDRFTLIRPRTA